MDVLKLTICSLTQRHVKATSKAACRRLLRTHTERNNLAILTDIMEPCTGIWSRQPVRLTSRAVHAMRVRIYVEALKAATSMAGMAHSAKSRLDRLADRASRAVHVPHRILEASTMGNCNGVRKERPHLRFQSKSRTLCMLFESPLMVSRVTAFKQAVRSFISYASDWC